MTEGAPTAVALLLAHYHRILLEDPRALAKLFSDGIASPRAVERFRLGLVQRAGCRSLVPDRCTVSREAWQAADLVGSNGRLRMLGSVILPLGSLSAELTGWASRRLRGRGRARTVVRLLDASRVRFVSLEASTDGGWAHLCSDPFDALALWSSGVHRVTVMLVDDSVTQVSAVDLERAFDTWLERQKPFAVRVLYPGTIAGRQLAHGVARCAATHGVECDMPSLPSGCSLLDVRRIEGPDALAEIVERGVLPSHHARDGSPSRRTLPQMPWASSDHTLSADLTAYMHSLGALGRTHDELLRRARDLETFRQACAVGGASDTSHLSRAGLRTIHERFVGEAHSYPPSRSVGATARLLASVRGFVEWCVRMSLVPAELLLEPIPLRRPRTPAPHVLSLTEVERILSMTMPTTACGLRDRAMLEVLYSTGIRRGELVSLDVGDIDADRRTLLVRHGKGDRTRVVPIGAQALLWVHRYVETARVRHLRTVIDRALFLTRRGRRIGVKAVTGRMRRCLLRAGVEKPGSCHVIRHSMATLMHDRGADIRDLQAMLGHASLTSTQLYTRVSVQRLHEVHARTHPGERRPSE